MAMGVNLEARQTAMRERHAPAPPTPAPSFSDRHYSVAQISKTWGLSPDATRKIFEHEPGVLVIGDALGGRGKRRYRTFRIPEPVLERVHRRLSNV
jgi:hypothetical protein